ncbi:MAG: glycine-rich domain-containing protein-like [Bacteroidia bacterium]
MAQENFNQSDSVKNAMRSINTIDFTMIKLKLMDKEEGQGWDSEFCDYVEIRYKRFLCMLFLHPEIQSVPTSEIDLFWHQHILDTHSYSSDCQRVFGKFIHHFPYFGMRGKEDAQNLIDSFEATKLLYAKLFGENYMTKFHNESSSKCHNCSSTIGVCMKCTNR